MYGVGILFVISSHFRTTRLIEDSLLPTFPRATAKLVRFICSTRDATVFTICGGYLERTTFCFKFDGKREAILVLACLWKFLFVGANLRAVIEGSKNWMQPPMSWLFIIVSQYDWYVKFLLISRPTLLFFHHMGIPGWLHVVAPSVLSFCVLRFTALKGSPAWWHAMVTGAPDDQPILRTCLSGILYQYSLFAAGAYLVPFLINKAKTSRVLWKALWLRAISILLLLFFPHFKMYPQPPSKGTRANWTDHADGAVFLCRECETIINALICFSMSAFTDLLWVGNLALVLQPGCYLLELIGKLSLGIYIWHEQLFRLMVSKTGIVVLGHKICPPLPEILHRVVLLCVEGAPIFHSMAPMLVFLIIACAWIGVALVSGALWQIFFGGFLDAVRFLHAVFSRI